MGKSKNVHPHGMNVSVVFWMMITPSISALVAPFFDGSQFYKRLLLACVGSLVHCMTHLTGLFKVLAACLAVG